jgi:predicted HTH transcriptional regulator
MELLALLKESEGKTVEFKRDLSSPDKVLRTLVAFANTAGGVLVVGVEDRSKRVVGVVDPLNLEERVANLVSERIRPPLVPDIEVLPWRRTHVVAVRVHPSNVRPHYLKDLGSDKGVFLRVGSTNRRADPVLIAELRRYTLNQSFDEQPLPELNSEAIDFRAASDSFAPVRKLRRRDLETLNVTTRHQGRLVPTIGGVLLFGKERGRYFPDAWIQAGRFPGTDRRRILDAAEIRSCLTLAVEEAIAFVRRNTSRELIIGGIHRTERWSFPEVAVREAIINAVVHADYAQTGAPLRISIFDDRFEVENPGLLPFGLTIEEIKRGVSKLRNRVIGRIFNELGLIEQWGSGIQRMLAACETAGLAPPNFEEIGTHFRVTLPLTQRRAPVLDEVDQAILAALQKSDGLSTRRLAEKIGRSARATRSRLLTLVQSGLVVEVGTGPNDPRRKYYLSGEMVT